MLYDTDFLVLDIYSFDFGNDSIISSGSSGYIMQQQLKFIIYTIETILVC